MSADGLYLDDQLRSLQKEMIFPSIREAVETALVSKVTQEVRSLISQTSGLTLRLLTLQIL